MVSLLVSDSTHVPVEILATLQAEQHKHRAETIFSNDEFPLARPYSSGYYAVQLVSDLDGKSRSL